MKISTKTNEIIKRLIGRRRKNYALPDWPLPWDNDHEAPERIFIDPNHPKQENKNVK